MNNCVNCGKPVTNPLEISKKLERMSPEEAQAFWERVDYFPDSDSLVCQECLGRFYPSDRY